MRNTKKVYTIKVCAIIINFGKSDQLVLPRLDALFWHVWRFLWILKQTLLVAFLLFASLLAKCLSVRSLTLPLFSLYFKHFLRWWNIEIPRKTGYRCTNGETYRYSWVYGTSLPGVEKDKDQPLIETFTPRSMLLINKYPLHQTLTLKSETTYVQMYSWIWEIHLYFYLL